MPKAPITTKGVLSLNRSDVSTMKAELGSRLKETEQVGSIDYNYGAAAVDKTYLAADLPITATVRITVTNASAAVNMIVPADIIKEYFINNTCGQALTVKVAGQVGVVVASTKKAILITNGTDIVRYTADI